MSRQMIFCLETNKKANTDWTYISDTIKHYYEIGNQVSIKPLYMKSKSRYRSKEVLKEIAMRSRCFLGETIVIYCIDTDNYESDCQHSQELEEIADFCMQNRYALIWFCHDVEDVYWKHSIGDHEKVQSAARFRRQNMIVKMEGQRLSSTKMRKHTSNILNVLDGYLKRTT